MITKTVTYTDYNGVEKTEKYRFNLTEAEVMEMELSTSGGLAETIETIVNTQDYPALIEIFKKLVLKAYGVKSPDGRRFDKSDEIRYDFEHTPAYSKIFMELATDAEVAAEFVNGIIPANMAAEVQKKVKSKE